MGSVEWHLTLNGGPTITDATEVRHTGVIQNHSDYDFTGATAVINSSPFTNDGNFASVAYDGANWQWFIFYQCPVSQSCSFDLRKTLGAVRAPYVRWGFQHGGPADCDTSNSDGFYIRNFEVWVR
jgi:hypothetical protein